MTTALEILQKSGVILTPTDTTFGLSCLAFDPIAVEKINKIKHRSKDKNYILLVDSEARLQRYVDVPDLAWDLIDFSEKPITIIYDKILDLPEHLLSDEGTIAIRIVKEPLLFNLIQKVKQPLISTSANLAGDPSPKRFEDISQEILDNIDFIMPETESFVPKYESSTLIQLSYDHTIKVIRP